MIEHLEGCFETKGFSGSEIQPCHSLFKRLVGNGLEVRFLWEILSEQTIRVFIGAALPCGIGMREVKLQFKHLSDLFVVSKLFTMIGSQGVRFMLDRQ